MPTPRDRSRPRPRPRPRPTGVQAEIRQKKPFRSRAQEATIALLRTASMASRVISRELEPWGLSLAQYNALRIIRGAGTAGIPTLAIRERMIEEGTTITRLVDKLESARLIRRERSEPDRRQVVCQVTDRGRALLAEMDPIADAADESFVRGLDASQLDQLVEVLDLLRASNAKRGAPRSAAAREAPPARARRRAGTRER